jgi:hypothetical protein
MVAVASEWLRMGACELAELGPETTQRDDP